MVKHSKYSAKTLRFTVVNHSKFTMVNHSKFLAGEHSLDAQVVFLVYKLQTNREPVWCTGNTGWAHPTPTSDRV